jgi:hypothetical protein
MARKLISPRQPSWPQLLSLSFQPPAARCFLATRVFIALVMVFAVLGPFSATAQIQQAWVAKYNNGITNGTNQAVKMALDTSGNIYVAGFSQNTNTNLGYVTIKYAPNGTQLWAARYDDTNYPIATPSGFALDSSNNIVVTGNALTVKYDTNGKQLWTVPYDGAAIAVDSGANAIITGYGAGFNTIKLSPNGSNVWSASYVSPQGPARSQALVMDSGGNAYVAGSDTYVCFHNGSYQQCNEGLLMVKYDQNGNQLWSNIPNTGLIPQIAGMAIDGISNVYVVENDYNHPWSTYSYKTDGSETWTAADPTLNGGSLAHGLAVDAIGNTFETGADAHYYPNTPFPIGTYKIGPTGAYVWTNLYYSVPVAASVGKAVAVDRANNVYVTGYSPGTNSGNDIVTIKYSNSGKQMWVQRYNGPGNGDDEGNAIAVDKNGNVYVTGYDTTSAGGTEIVTIKYSPVIVQRRTDGTVILQAQGSPGESFDIQASADLLNWLDLGSVLADTNGLMQFDDTNAPTFPARFYLTNPQ